MRPSEALERHRDEVLEILARYPVSNPRVFGSVPRLTDAAMVAIRGTSENL